MRQYLKIFRLILVLAIFFQPAVLWSKSKDTAKKAEKAETTTPSGTKAKTTAAPGNIPPPKPVAQDDTPLIIQRLYLKSNTIHVDLARSGGAALKPTDYPAIKLKVEIPGHKIPGSWALLQVDPQRRLTRLNGLVTFDTRLAIRKPGPVKAQLIKGKWVHAKTTTLRPLADKTAVRKPVVTAPLANQAAGMPVQGAARPAEDNPPSSLVRGVSPNTGIAMPTAAARSIIEERLGGAGEPRAVFYDGGIAIDQPAEGAEFDAGSTITVRYEITREAEAGDIRIAVVRPGHTVATVTRPYTPPGADAGPRFHTVELTLPRHIDTSDRYLVFAQLGETRLHGMSHLFTINGRSQLMRQAAAPRPGVDIISPLGGDTVVLNAEKEVRFRTPDADSDAYCGGRVTVATVRMADGHETRIAYNMAVAPGENRFTWEVSEDDYSIGDYQLKFIMENGCVVRTAPFHVSGCDYALESVSFADGRSLASGIDVGAGRSIRGAFRVTVRWNGIPLPPIFAPGTDWGNQLRVTATRTGQVICVPLAGADFNYAAASGGLIAVDVPFSFDRDDVAAMRTESRNVPLEFSLHPYGASLDTDEDNNTLRTQMKVLNLRETDFHIGIYAREFHLERFLHTAGTVPKYEYRFSQTIHLRNRTLNDAGGSPAPVDSVPVEWRVEWRPAGASEYSALPLSSGRFQFTHVTGDWQTINLTERFETLIDDPGRNYRLVVVADPDHDFLDPDRRSNLSRVNIGNPD